MANKHRKNSNHADEDSDSDGAPEEVTFQEGLDKMLETKRSIAKKVDEEKERLKQKRKRQEEMFIEQKKQKLARLESMKLPEDVLEGIDDKPQKTSKKSENAKMITEEEDDAIDDDEVDDDDDGGNVDMADDDEDDDEEEEEEEIPEMKTGVIPIHDIPTRKINSAFEKARDFKNKALFGQSAKRQSIKTYLSNQDKRKFVR